MSKNKLSLEILEPKLDSLARCLNRIESKKPFTLESLERDFDLQDIISVNLERSVQLSVDIASVIISFSQNAAPIQMADAFEVLEKMGWLKPDTRNKMKKAVGFRNIIVHEYEKVNWEIVFKIATEHLNDFRGYASEVVAKLKTGH